VSSNLEHASASKAALWTGRVMSGLVILFLVFDGVSKLTMVPQVVEATQRIGFPAATIRPIGIVLLACTALYTIPRTAFLGAILLTGFLGGSVAAKVRLEDPLFSSILFGVYFGLLVWGGLYFRAPWLRGLIPIERRRVAAP